MPGGDIIFEKEEGQDEKSEANDAGIVGHAFRADEIKAQRCKGGAIFTAPGSCGDIEFYDIQFYVVKVKFDALKDEMERMHFKRLPTAFKLPAEEVDKLRDVAPPDPWGI